MKIKQPVSNDMMLRSSSVNRCVLYMSTKQMFTVFCLSSCSINKTVTHNTAFESSQSFSFKQCKYAIINFFGVWF